MAITEATAQKVKLTRTPMFTGIVLFLISEVFLFGSLFWTYYYLRHFTPVWPPAGVTIDRTLASINTAVLLLSSLTVWLATRAIQRGSQRGLALGLGATAALGATFLGITFWEWFHESFQPWSHAYGSIFFTLTGFHGLHVFFGVLLLLVLLVRTMRQKYTAQSHLSVEIGSIYWHFVDFIWLFVFSTIFIVK